MAEAAAESGGGSAPVGRHEPASFDSGTLINLLLSYSPSGDAEIVKRAYNFAKEAHHGQTRASGEPYISHPVEVATILAEHRFDSITLAAALLHDVIEDCRVTEEDLAAQFGQEIASIVVGVTKISSISSQTRQETEAENLRRMLVAVARDIRVLLIKLADRLHNMRTIKSLDRSRVERISRETLEIYTPLANRMGMSTIRAELEDLSFRNLMPEKYAEIEKEMEELVGTRKKALDEAAALVTEKLNEAGIVANVTGRTKAIYSVYKKMMRQNRPIGEIFDLLAMRILVSSARDCYGAIGIVHTIWKPIPRRFKDYVAMPKPNMYQAIHTTVIGPGNGPLEIQIKTHQMHLTAEEGIAAHWKYKSTGTVDERLGWLKRILEWQRDAVTAQEFMDSLRIDLYSDQVFVLTPKGDILELPAGSTPIDVAFAIHSEIGAKLAGAKVDGRMVPITSRLTSGAVVEILTSSSARPSRDWLDAVRSPRARQKIRYLLKDKETEDRKLLEVAAEPPPEKPQERHVDVSSAKGGKAAAVVIEGVSDMVVRFGKCCNPVPGDPILGYLSRGRGVSIHRANCPNAAALSGETARFVTATWAGEKGHYAAGIEVEGGDRIGLLADLTQVIAREGGNIIQADVRTKEIGRDRFVIEVQNANHLNVIIEKLREVKGIRRVSRSGPQ